MKLKFNKSEVCAIIYAADAMVGANNWTKYKEKREFVNSVISKIKGFAPFLNHRKEKMTSKDALKIIESMPIEKKTFLAAILKKVMYFSCEKINTEETKLLLLFQKTQGLPEMDFIKANEIMKEYEQIEL